MMDSDPDANLPPLVQQAQDQYRKYSRQYQYYLDRTTPHVVQRWLATGGIFALFMLRVIIAQGWYIICYAHAIYILNLLLAFLQPRFDPSLEADLVDDEIENGGAEATPLPTSAKDDEFRPFVRRLPEWSFWLSATRATILALVASMFSMFDVPVFWPILVMYFCVLFVLTMRRQIQHMIKYKYIPFDFGRKARYGGKH
ncbi:hypothetical protein FRC14_004968 [Serendipita sp. 396]|nr:hypothetical protein FRC14_004968 [Serendipita sp. 396]KAG8825560.1 hypothetical protein FRC19_011155 [Serendipita sp. 401]KAG8860767.1 hypothetical protein FRB91_001031 [Serendipita sp. 411]KAG8872372.1 hypothetical protein FRC20_009528 [Serendipita sp. 405]